MSSRNLAVECPRFNRCSINACPLNWHPKHPTDKEQICTLAKSVRQRIAANYPNQLMNAGLTAREAAGKRIFASLPLAVKSQLARTGKSNIQRINSGKEAKNG
jgi:hypothetical protein